MHAGGHTFELGNPKEKSLPTVTEKRCKRRLFHNTYLAEVVEEGGAQRGLRW